ncbi:N-acetyltransferase [Photorhabdus luminescens]|uniref:N-acetyltransferase n=1 Tax=Photorhabdus akhurstii TaxID=171438 RepID=A0ABX8LY96_9GAMM|nr:MULTISPECIES: GNAT family N-acetyltransferase [Photorhabdus]KGM27713.1 histone acetyltransferase [Photorhabdus luminescens]MBS9427592.1 N-acetyltransferase [Photorhabdus akhurstii]MBS9432594.1 N-acetyltransferase [Photorhabdus hainanensis]MCC8459593.1 GNAT family N-acetyltransferase [Photorhabdus aegyptia]PQQ29615.1 N-acetyltransferase [Photorhabdus luminescens]
MEKLHRWEKDGYVVSTDKNKLDITIIQRFLTKSIWAEGIDKETVKLSIENSLNFGLYKNTQQIGFARIVTDFTTFGYLIDVFVLDDYRGLGLGRWLMTCCLEHPQIAQLRHIMLVTSMAPWLYEKMGYSPVNEENFVWQLVRPDIYKQSKR